MLLIISWILIAGLNLSPFLYLLSLAVYAWSLDKMVGLVKKTICLLETIAAQKGE